MTFSEGVLTSVLCWRYEELPSVLHLGYKWQELRARSAIKTLSVRLHQILWPLNSFEDRSDLPVVKE